MGGLTISRTVTLGIMSRQERALTHSWWKTQNWKPRLLKPVPTIFIKMNIERDVKCIHDPVAFAVFGVGAQKRKTFSYRGHSEHFGQCWRERKFLD